MHPHCLAYNNPKLKQPEEGRGEEERTRGVGRDKVVGRRRRWGLGGTGEGGEMGGEGSVTYPTNQGME